MFYLLNISCKITITCWICWTPQIEVTIKCIFFIYLETIKFYVYDILIDGLKSVIDNELCIEDQSLST